MADTSVPKALEGLAISKTKELKGTEKRDTLIEIEKKYQQKWEEEHVFEVDAPSTAEFPLGSISPDELRSVRERLQKALGREPIVHPYTDNSMLGGVKMQIGDRLIGVGRAKLNPDDHDIPEIGDELAVARALSDLGHRLLVVAAGDIQRATREKVRLTH